MEQKIIKLLEAAGGRLARSSLFEQLGFPNNRPTQKYWSAEQRLVDSGKVERRRGRSGGLYLTPVDSQEQQEDSALETVVDEEPDAEHLAEADYYGPALKAISEGWATEPGFKQVFATLTARQGRRRTGGKWSRPDIVLCTITDWIFSSRPEGDVRTLEMKRFEALDVLAVYEALSHKSRAHYSYVLVVNYPAELSDEHTADMEVILSVAAQHGIGIITAVDVADWSTWTFELDATRSNANQLAVHQMVLDQVPADVRTQFQKALRSINVQF